MCVMASSTKPLAASVIPSEEVCSPMVFFITLLSWSLSDLLFSWFDLTQGFRQRKGNGD